MWRVYTLFSVISLGLAPLNGYAAQVKIGDVSYAGKSATQVTFNLSAATSHHFFILNNPSRLVVDIENASFQQAVTPVPLNHPLLVNVRSAARNAHDVRVVFELKGDAEAKTQMNGSKLQVELTAKQQQPSMARLEKAPVLPAQPAPSKKQPLPEPVAMVPKPAIIKASKPEKAHGRDIVVAIDAGHGGKDVGAQGANGTQEKDVVFAIAKRLEGMVNSHPGMKAVMVRRGDYFVHLNERRRIARDAKADLFVSIHADAFSDASAHGASVYTLSKKGASNAAARWLANSENASDLAGGISLADKDDTLTSVLLDLSQTATKEASQNVGNKVLKNFRQVGHLHRDSVQKAGFVVLKSPDIPSILVETAFISNPEEERHLNSRDYQDKMARAVFGGVLAHFRQYAPANTLMAQMSKSVKSTSLAAAKPVTDEPVKLAMATAPATTSDKFHHVTSRGDTLSQIAQQHGVSMRAIRIANGMENGELRPGQVLTIPRNS